MRVERMIWRDERLPSLTSFGQRGTLVRTECGGFYTPKRSCSVEASREDGSDEDMELYSLQDPASTLKIEMDCVIHVKIAVRGA